MWLLKEAESISQEIVEVVKPYCERVVVAGSIRRKKGWVNDIDIVLIPSNQGMVGYTLTSLMGRYKMGGSKLMRFQHPKGIKVDIYVATLGTWYTLVLVRTGSAAHNIKLCRIAQQKGMKLHADGSGIGTFIDCEGHESLMPMASEEQVFQTLGLPWLPPEKRV